MDSSKMLQPLQWLCGHCKNNGERVKRLDSQGKTFVYFYNSLTESKIKLEI